MALHEDDGLIDTWQSLLPVNYRQEKINFKAGDIFTENITQTSQSFFFKLLEFNKSASRSQNENTIKMFFFPDDKRKYEA